MPPAAPPAGPSCRDHEVRGLSRTPRSRARRASGACARAGHGAYSTLSSRWAPNQDAWRRIRSVAPAARGTPYTVVKKSSSSSLARISSARSGGSSSGWVADGDPTDRHAFTRGQRAVHVHHGVDRHARAAAEDGTRKERCPRRNEHAVAKPGSVDMCVRADQHVVSDQHRVVAAGADQRVFHDHAPGAELDAAVLRGDDRIPEDARVRSDPDVAHDHRRRGHPRRGVDERAGSAMLDQHAYGRASAAAAARR